MIPLKVKRLTTLREARDETRAALGARADVHPARVGQFENGRAVPPADSVELRRLAEALGWKGDPAALLEEVDGGPA
jgi:transcriptional regulator with XRE-family HTH domain